MAITKLQIIKSLLARGYFPKELPPPFQTSSLARHIHKVAKDWDAHIASLTSEQRKRAPWTSRPVRFDLARKGYARRVLNVVNPINQYNLCRELAENYSEIVEFTGRSPWSLTKASIDFKSGRAVPLPSFSALAEVRLKAYATSGSILATDIASFYHSIYTHSIPWALHSKAVSKARKFDEKLYGNKLDRLIRECQDGQTKGIPVGPDTSRVISEIILSAIDQELVTQVGGKIVGGYRYIDDVFFCFASAADGEEVLSCLRDAVHHYELDLNPSKTRQQPALTFNEETWPHRLRAARIRTGKNQRQSLFSFFSTVIEVASGHASESIAVYALKASARVRIDKSNWEVYEAFLIRLSREHTNTIDLVCKIVCTYASLDYPISNLVGQWANDLIVSHTPANHHFEVAWALWSAISLKLTLNASAVQALSKTDNSVCALLTLHAEALGLCAQQLDTSDWFVNLSRAALFDDRWLLVYESMRKGWLTSVPADLAAEQFFAALARHKVEFYSRSAHNRPVDIPLTARMIGQISKRTKRRVLPGNIFVPKGELEVETMGGDYEDGPDWDDIDDLDDLDDGGDGQDHPF